MPKFFVVSDIHSFYTLFKEALDKAGFDETNEDHWLISCGDAFDRGEESERVLNYLMSLKRKVLVKGNHDILLKDCCNRGFAYTNDHYNGTINTIFQLGKIDSIGDFTLGCQRTMEKLTDYYKTLVNYFETEKYIFVHSWIPVKLEYTDKMPYISKKSYMKDWRNGNDVEWEESMWYNPFMMWQGGLNKTSKTIVFGHWHCSAGHSLESKGAFSEFNEDAVWEPFVKDDIISIDACTAHSNKVNVVVLEDNFI